MLDPLKVPLEDQELIDQVISVLSVKREVWQYEHEYSWFFDINSCVSRDIEGKQLHFVKFPPTQSYASNFG